MIVEEGHPLQAPCKTTLTNFFLGSYESNKILPPSDETAGFMYSSKIEIIFSEVSSKSILGLFLVFIT